MKKIVKKDGKIYEVFSNDASFRHTTWTEVGTYDEPVVEDNEEKIVNKRKKRDKS